jgi:uncharacterized membrane protein YkoI
MRLAVLLVALALAGCGEDDLPVDRDTPDARRAVAEALAVVSGRVVEVARDRDNDKWEVVVEQHDRRYEVELAPDTFELLRLDWD